MLKDVFYIICSFLSPLDLFNLRLVSKWYAEIIKNDNNCWKTQRQIIEFYMIKSKELFVESSFDSFRRLNNYQRSFKYYNYRLFMCFMLNYYVPFSCNVEFKLNNNRNIYEACSKTILHRISLDYQLWGAGLFFQFVDGASFFPVDSITDVFKNILKIRKYEEDKIFNLQMQKLTAIHLNLSFSSFIPK